LFSLILSLALCAVPCGRCVSRGEVCFPGRYSCGDNLVCSPTENGPAPVCLPTFEQGAVCTSVGIDTCEKGFVCNYTGTGTCDLFPKGNRIVNDYCLDDTWCLAPAFKCSGNKCAVAATDGSCNAASCAYGSYCDVAENPAKCKPLKGEGEDCSTVSCGPALYCSIASTKCVSDYSIPENDGCNFTSQCKPGLTCHCYANGKACDRKCVKPVYFFLGPAGGVAWGQECDPTDAGTSTGCVCNYNAKIYMYLKEVGSTTSEGCLPVRKELYKCLSEKGCNRESLEFRSCMRENCWGQYNTKDTVCNGLANVPPKCSAQGLAAMISLLVAFLLL
jgi:hypothetical protein